MASYLLSVDAVEDLREIVRYTRKEWGIKQVEIYREKLRDRFVKIGNGSVIKKPFSKSLPDVFVTRAEKHLVFYITPSNSKPIIIAVLHDSRDFVRHLVGCLEYDICHFLILKQFN